MNNEPSDPRRKLLNEVFRTDSLDAFDGQLKERAWAEFRRARLIRRTGLISALAVTATLVTGGLLFRASERNKTRALVQTMLTRTESKQSAPVRAEARAGDTTLTDEQLLAFFPPDSCFLAEVDGRKILVFRNPEVREKYFH